VGRRRPPHAVRPLSDGRRRRARSLRSVAGSRGVGTCGPRARRGRARHRHPRHRVARLRAPRQRPARKRVPIRRRPRTLPAPGPSSWWRRPDGAPGGCAGRRSTTAARTARSSSGRCAAGSGGRTSGPGHPARLLVCGRPVDATVDIAREDGHVIVRLTPATSSASPSAVRGTELRCGFPAVGRGRLRMSAARSGGTLHP
jgi:hypothetical protein